MSCFNICFRSIIVLVLASLALISCDMVSVPRSGENDQADREALYSRWWRIIPFRDKDGRWGYRTKGSGKVIIQPRFEYAEPFFKEYATVEINGRKASIDLAGAVVFLPGYPLSEGLYCVKSGSWLGILGGKPKFGFADRSGRYVIPPIYDNAYDFSQGLAAVRINGKYGYIDKIGRMVIKQRFTWAGPFSEDRAAVLLDDEEGYIDKTGRVVIDPQFRWAAIFSDGLAAVLIYNKWGYINTVGEVVIKPRFTRAWPFYQGAARVEVDEKQLFINHKGEPLLPGKSIRESTKPRDVIRPHAFPYIFDPASFKTSDTIRGYHPKKGLIFDARGTALSPTVCIPVGTYSLRFASKGSTGLKIDRRIDILLVPAEGDIPRWPHLIGGEMKISARWKEYTLGPVEFPSGCYKVWIALDHDLWGYGGDGTRHYDSEYFVEVKDIILEQL
jgi:WG repeat protein